MILLSTWIGKEALPLYLPEIPEEQTRGRLRNLYHTIEMTLHVPLVSDVFRVLAHFPGFLHYAFEASRSNLLSVHFEQASDELRAIPLPDPPLPKLPVYVTRFDLRSAARVLPVFHYANAKLLLLVTAWHEALSARPIHGHSEEGMYVPPGIPAYFPEQVPLLRLELASKSMQALLKQINDTHGSSAPASDYRALAFYPTFLTGAWRGLQPHVGSTWYRETCHQLMSDAQQLAHQLPYRIPLSPDRLQKVISPREIAACTGIITMYRHLLPKLMIEVDLMTRMLETNK